MFYQYNREIQIIHNQRIFFEAHLHREAEIIAMFHGTAEVTVGGGRSGCRAAILPLSRPT